MYDNWAYLVGKIGEHSWLWSGKMVGTVSHVYAYMAD